MSSATWRTFLAVLLIVSVGNTQALECVTCNEITFDENVPTFIQNYIAGIPNQITNCVKSRSGAKISTCPADPANSTKVYKCGYFQGSLTAISKSGKVVMRGCGLVSKTLKEGYYKQDSLPNIPLIQESFGHLEKEGYDIDNVRGNLCITSGVTTSHPMCHAVVLICLILQKLSG